MDANIKKKKKKGQSARSMLSKSLGFSKKDWSESDSEEDCFHDVRVQSAPLKDDDSADSELETYDFVAFEQSEAKGKVLLGDSASLGGHERQQRSNSPKRKAKKRQKKTDADSEQSSGPEGDGVVGESKEERSRSGKEQKLKKSHRGGTKDSQGKKGRKGKIHRHRQLSAEAGSDQEANDHSQPQRSASAGRASRPVRKRTSSLSESTEKSGRSLALSVGKSSPLKGRQASGLRKGRTKEKGKEKKTERKRRGREGKSECEKETEQKQRRELEGDEKIGDEKCANGKGDPGQEQREETVLTKEEPCKEKPTRTLTAALDDQPVEFADERKRRIPLNLRRSASLSKLLQTDEMAAMRGEANARGLFSDRSRPRAGLGAKEPKDNSDEDECAPLDEDFDKPQPKDTVLRSKGRSGWRSLLKKSQLSRIDLKKGWRPGSLLQNRKAKSQSDISRSKPRRSERPLGPSTPPPPEKAYRDLADLNSIESLKLLLAGDERRPSFKRFTEATYSSENLLFHDAVCDFRNESDDELRRILAAQTMKTFIGNSAPMELNLDTREVRRLQERWEEVEGATEGAVVPVELFDAAFDSVFSLLYYDLYMRYIVSKTFEDFEAGHGP